MEGKKLCRHTPTYAHIHTLPVLWARISHQYCGIDFYTVWPRVIS